MQVRNNMREPLRRNVSFNLNKKTFWKKLQFHETDIENFEFSFQTNLKKGNTFSIEPEQHNDSNPKLFPL